MNASVRADGPPPTGAAAVLVRIPASDATWARWLPPVPAGDEVTVSASRPELADVPADDLIGSGYRFVGTSRAVLTTGRPVIDVLVPVQLLEAHPAWWAALRALADRTFVTEFGPVARVLGPVLDLHRAARTTHR